MNDHHFVVVPTLVLVSYFDNKIEASALTAVKFTLLLHIREKRNDSRQFSLLVMKVNDNK
jgi:transposase